VLACILAINASEFWVLTINTIDEIHSSPCSPRCWIWCDIRR